MEKTVLFGVLIALLLFGAIFVSAQLSPSNTATEKTPAIGNPSCGCGCNDACGGQCGESTCNCGR